MSVRRVDFEDASLALLEAEAKRLRTSLSGLVNMLVEGSWTPPWRLQAFQREPPESLRCAPVEPQDSPRSASIEARSGPLAHVALARITSFTAVKDSPTTEETATEETKTDSYESEGVALRPRRPQLPGMERPPTAQQQAVQAAWAVFDQYQSERPKAPVVAKWWSHLKHRTDELVRILNDLAPRGKLDEVSYVWAAIRGEAERANQPPPPVYLPPESSIIVTPDVVASWDKGPKTEEEAEAMFGERMREMQARIARMPERREVPS